MLVPAAPSVSSAVAFVDTAEADAVGNCIVIAEEVPVVTGEAPVVPREEPMLVENPITVAEDVGTVMDTYWNAYVYPVTEGRSVGVA